MIEWILESREKMDSCPICMHAMTAPGYVQPSDVGPLANRIRSPFTRILRRDNVRLGCGHALCLECAQEGAYHAEGIDVVDERATIQCPVCRRRNDVRIV